MTKAINGFVLLAMVFATANTSADAVFGRLYTTPKQREQLDAIRDKIPDETIIAPVADTQLLHTRPEHEQTGNTPAITLDGLVYRSDGKNTAWINRNSTNTGTLENQYTRINERDVQSNQVRIVLPNNPSPVELKVGQQYDVNTKQVHDLMKNPANPEPASDTR